MPISDSKFNAFTDMVDEQAKLMTDRAAKIDEQLTAIKNTVERMLQSQDQMAKDFAVNKNTVERIHERQVQMVEDLAANSKLLTGNGTPENGVIIRLDRLSQAQEHRSRLVWVAVTASVGSLIGVIAKLFFGQH